MLKVLVSVLAILPCVLAQDAASGNVTIMGDITVTGALRVMDIRANLLNVDGSLNVAGKCTAENLVTAVATATVVECPGFSSPTGMVHIVGTVESSSANVSEVLAVSSFLQRDVKQWALAVHEDFEEKVTGWSSNAVNSCDKLGEGSTHLAGHCAENEGEVSKTFSGLGTEHTHLRMRANFHFLDSWEGETAFAKLGDKVVWTEVHDTRGMMDLGENLCGGEHADTKMGTLIDVTVPHTGDSIDVSFGGLLDEHPCNESFGVDDVMISIR